MALSSELYTKHYLSFIPLFQHLGETHLYPVKQPLVTAALFQQLLQLLAQLLRGEQPLARDF